nr:hypothetical protein BHI3_16750 [Bacteriovorax sp. HI3]
MKKTFLFVLSVSLAFGITFYIKRRESQTFANKSREWKTFVKKSDSEVASHNTTSDEFQAAKIVNPDENKKERASRTVASVNPFKGFMVRQNRILMGDIDQKYEDEATELKMLNAINPDWKEIMGEDLMRFQPEDTKLMVKEEVPVIKIVDGKGRFLEQVIVTYLKKNGDKNSFKALVDSETGTIVETWDRTIHEQLGRRKGRMAFPSVNESGIVTK